MPNTESTDEEELQEYDEVFYGDDNESPEPEEEPTKEEQPEEEPETDADTEEQPAEDEPGSEEDAEEQSEEQAEEQSEEEPEEELITLKWRGQEIKATQQEVINMAQRNFDSTHKYQEAAKLRKQYESEIELIEKIKKGDKNALAQLAAQAEIDPIDLIDLIDEDIEQGQPDQAEPFVSKEVEKMMEEVAEDTALYDELRDIEEILPEAVVSTMAKDPNTFYSIVAEVKSGDAKIVLPRVQTALAQLDNIDRSMVMNNPENYATFYMNIKNDMIAQSQPKQETPKQETPPAKKANYAETAVRKSGNRQRRGTEEVDSFTSDEAYEAILQRLNSQ